ncbi:TetR/AcrR family transcriptional regulator [Planotetraspora kaengkrachanensis]|uniref:TetR family transcriptional regulator n=1 Tax=Planotetraspora kaengkrachanensis TaxID=575193 RepID=A0A8J3LWH5_9ACTN|nr:TetR/AcrR family transcriptional regulator [Planotetraspora kaengkrachanensis]GIG80393.1 TetR family transcriptional regulator [Planotetraspora kaengkrachanensis]
MDVKTRILQAAATLLTESPEADISTRAVCEAAGVGAPALYRQFGDKEGLLTAVVDYGFEQYLASKRAARPSADPVQDLRDGWDNHVAFAVDNPNYYRLMYSPGLSAPPGAAAEAHALLVAVLERCAAAGRLRISPEVAAQMVMSANAGVALSLVSRPAIYTDPEFSRLVRDAVIAFITVDGTPGTGAGAPGSASGAPSVPVTATTLSAQLRDSSPADLTSAETALLQQWLAVLGAQSEA